MISEQNIQELANWLITADDEYQIRANDKYDVRVQKAVNGAVLILTEQSGDGRSISLPVVQDTVVAASVVCNGVEVEFKKGVIVEYRQNGMSSYAPIRLNDANSLRLVCYDVVSIDESDVFPDGVEEDESEEGGDE